MENKNNMNNVDSKLNRIFTNRLYIIILACICTLLWGSAFPTVKIGYKLFNISTGDIPSYILFAGLRFFIAGIITLLLCYILRLDKNLYSFSSIKTTYITKDFIIKISILAFLLTFFQYVCFYIGLAFASAINSSIINASSTIFTVLLSFIIFKGDTISFTKVAGIILSFIGIIIVTFRNVSLDSLSSIRDIDSLSRILDISVFSLKGEGILLIAALSFAFGTVFSKRYATTYNPATLTAIQLTLGGLLLTIVGLILGGTLDISSSTALLLLGYLSLLSSVAFTIWTILLKYNKASKIAIFNFLTPVFGVILSGIILKEDIFSIPVGLSLALACLGIVLMNIEKETK